MLQEMKAIFYKTLLVHLDSFSVDTAKEGPGKHLLRRVCCKYSITVTFLLKHNTIFFGSKIFFQLIQS